MPLQGAATQLRPCQSRSLLLKKFDLTDNHLETLFDEHAGDLLRFFSSRVADGQSAIDLVAETFAQALASRKRFRGPDLDAARPWLFGIARNLLRRYHRDGRVERLAMEKVRMERVNLDADDVAEIEEFIESEATRAEVADGMSQLPSEQQDAIHQRIVLGQTYADVAASLGITETTARARVSRGLRRLRSTVRGADLAESAGSHD